MFVDLLGIAIGIGDLALNAPDAAADPADVGAKNALGAAKSECGGGSDSSCGLEALGGGPVCGEEGEGAPREGEPEIGVEPTAKQFEAVGEDDEDTEGDEGEQPEGDDDGAEDTEGDSAGQRDDGNCYEDGLWDTRAQGPVVEFVEGVGTDAYGEEEGKERRGKPVVVKGGSQRGTEDYVAQMPEGIRRVE